MRHEREGLLVVAFPAVPVALWLIASGRSKRTSLTVFRLMACFVDSSVDHRQSYV